MTTVYVNLYDDSGNSIVTQVSVVCDAQQARQIEKWQQTIRFRFRKLPKLASRNMTFVQFKKAFID